MRIFMHKSVSNFILHLIPLTEVTGSRSAEDLQSLRLGGTEKEPWFVSYLDL
jgi:hypothetical protein